MATTVREQALNRAFAEFAGSLVSEFDVVALLDQLVGLVTELFRADAASILLRDVQGALDVSATSPDGTRAMELYQLRSGQGPGMDTVRSGSLIAVPDLDAVSDRWELFVPVAREHGFEAVYALPMRVRDQIVGALSLYSSRPGKLPARDLTSAQALADVATIGILQIRASTEEREAVQQTQQAMRAQLVVEQAKGMLAASGVSMDEAYDLLRHFARYRESRILEVAADLTAGRIQPAVIIADGTLSRPATVDAESTSPSF